MNVIVRQMTRKGDPIVRVNLPKQLICILETTSKKYKRRIQDQFIRSIAESLKDEAKYTAVFEKILPDLKKAYQV